MSTWLRKGARRLAWWQGREERTWPLVLGFLSQISKCFARLMGFRRTVLQLVHVKRRVIFLVVFAFLWKTGFV